MRESELVLNGSYSKSTQPKARAPPEQPALLTIYLTFMFNKIIIKLIIVTWRRFALFLSKGFKH